MPTGSSMLVLRLTCASSLKNINTLNKASWHFLELKALIYAVLKINSESKKAIKKTITYFALEHTGC